MKETTITSSKIAGTIQSCGLLWTSKTISPICVPDFSKFQRRPALFCYWRTVRCWHFFSFRGESLRSVFTIALNDFRSILKSWSILLMKRLGYLLPSLERFWCCFSYNMSKGVRFWEGIWCCWGLCAFSLHHKLLILVLLAALLSLIFVPPRGKVQ